MPSDSRSPHANQGLPYKVEQGEKLMTSLKVMVRGLTRLESLVPAVQALGRRHAGYGILADVMKAAAAEVDESMAVAGR